MSATSTTKADAWVDRCCCGLREEKKAKLEDLLASASVPVVYLCVCVCVCVCVCGIRTQSVDLLARLVSLVLFHVILHV